MRAEIEHLCAEAREDTFRAVVVPSSRVALAYEMLEGSGIKVSCLIGFPLGWSDPDAKRYEIDAAIDAGAHEIEYVPSLAQLKEKQHALVLREMRDAVDACDERPMKLLIEASLWTEAELNDIARLALDSGAKYLSTGLVSNLSLVESVRAAVGPNFGLKVEMGSIEMALAAVEAGVDIFSLARLARPGSKNPAFGI